jgi:flagellar biogenesis protein FliO
MSLSPLAPASDWTLWLAIGGGVVGLLILIVAAVLIYRRMGSKQAPAMTTVQRPIIQPTVLTKQVPFAGYD